eukprot:TRINITY_DN2870_c0_g1_i2.p1 TRINITY_DN2870_c0_g1~~TRINITY_DN2870_c0_g1_i2.p1  ORF type:complete len:341 (+),score=91.76 TRINITY_DN2870_c0_g1_i2:254-1276(+)
MSGDTIERMSLPRGVQIMNLNGTSGNESLEKEETTSHSNGSNGHNGNGLDDPDAWPGLPGRSRASGSRLPTERGFARMPVERDSEVYNMNHRKRGIALIFNHENFDPRLELRKRNGTRADRENLKKTFRNLEFEVRAFDDLDFANLDKILEDVANDDHSESDCLLMFVLSHGESGLIYAKDSAYKPERLWSYFNGKNCPTLAGKPKMIFIQACQGDQLDHGVELVNNRTETDSSAMGYRLPIFADFIIGYSTMPGYYSWRNTTAGSWFIQALCAVFNSHSDHDDVISMMTKVSRKVALDFESNTPGTTAMHEKKQIPFIASMLTRKIFLLKKLNVPTGLL